MYVSCIECRNLTPYRFVVASSQMMSGYTNLGFWMLMSMLNQLKKATCRMHAISGFICWMTDKYARIWEFPLMDSWPLKSLSCEPSIKVRVGWVYIIRLRVQNTSLYLHEPYFRAQDWTVQVWRLVSQTWRSVFLSEGCQDLARKWCHIITTSFIFSYIGLGS